MEIKKGVLVVFKRIGDGETYRLGIVKVIRVSHGVKFCDIRTEVDFNECGIRESLIIPLCQIPKNEAGMDPKKILDRHLGEAFSTLACFATNIAEAITNLHL
jgi:hypothetical protein